VIGGARAGNARLAEQLDALLLSLGFSLGHRFDESRVLAAIGHDKKRAAGRQRWILPVAIGQVVEVDDVTHVEVAAALTAIQAPATVV
jgi:3-dehydroquinate synthetase